jgi:hypothetical protein
MLKVKQWNLDILVETEEQAMLIHEALLKAIKDKKGELLSGDFALNNDITNLYA